MPLVSAQAAALDAPQLLECSYAIHAMTGQHFQHGTAAIGAQDWREGTHHAQGVEEVGPHLQPDVLLRAVGEPGEGRHPGVVDQRNLVSNVHARYAKASRRRESQARERGNGAMKIGELAQQAGVSVRALRYYEEQGLLSPERTPSGQRRYTEDTVEVVRLFFTAADPAAGRLTATR